MKTCIYYATRSGNTRRLAEAVAEALQARGQVRIHELDGSTPAIPDDVDLLLVGGPTEGRHATPPVTSFLGAIPANALRGRSVVAFDTRLDWPRWLSGSAADDIAKRLEALGGQLLARPETFLVSTKPELVAGELERAGRWAASLPEPAISNRSTTAGVA